MTIHVRFFASLRERTGIDSKTVDADGLPSDLEVSHVSLNDGTVEGLRHTSLPAMSIQFHSEASPGPRDNEYIFTQFLEMVDDAQQ